MTAVLVTYRMTALEYHLVGVWRAGWASRWQGKAITAVPYAPQARLARKAWLAGYDAATARQRRYDVT
jgi:hypothetical protein